MPLSDESQHLITFITPFGRYMSKRAPFGHYNCRMDEAMAGILHVRKIVDDVIAYDSTYTDHVRHVRSILQRCVEKGISLKREKFVFAQKEATFCGYVVSGNGYCIHPDTAQAIKQFPTPTNLTDLRSFFGLANQLSNFTDKVAKIIEPLRPLLKPRNEWDKVHDKEFQETKNALTETPVLAYYDPLKPTFLHTDASRLKGLGFVFKQQQTDGT